VNEAASLGTPRASTVTQGACGEGNAPSSGEGANTHCASNVPNKRSGQPDFQPISPRYTQACRGKRAQG